VVSRVATTLIEFASRWIQSPSGYDFLIASTMNPNWVTIHQPVISSQGSHTLYTEHNMSQPLGKLVICPLRCGARLGWKIVKNGVNFNCPNCKSSCKTIKDKSDARTLLGRCGLRKTIYPQPQFNAEWKVKKDNITSSTPTSTKFPEAVTRSTSLPQPSTSKPTPPPPEVHQAPPSNQRTLHISRAQSSPLLNQKQATASSSSGPSILNKRINDREAQLTMKRHKKH
jgi:hypothetical protein